MTARCEARCAESGLRCTLAPHDDAQHLSHYTDAKGEPHLWIFSVAAPVMLWPSWADEQLAHGYAEFAQRAAAVCLAHRTTVTQGGVPIREALRLAVRSLVAGLAYEGVIYGPTIDVGAVLEDLDRIGRGGLARWDMRPQPKPQPRLVGIDATGGWYIEPEGGPDA